MNLALPRRTDGSRWLRAVDAVVPPALRAFRPQVIVSQHGCDAHGHDPSATWTSASTRSAPRCAGSTSCPTSSPRALGRPRGGGTRSPRWSRSRGRTSSPRWSTPRRPVHPVPLGWREHVTAVAHRETAELMGTARSHSVPGTRGTTPRTRWIGPSSRRARPSSPAGARRALRLNGRGPRGGAGTTDPPDDVTRARFRATGREQVG
ncbi:hypothetical protein NKG05_06340 [Oerskovia sp. M15]